ncbi:hypothetical protein [Galactobacter valiniphilus]|uniref:hypothetical protein n=1 Tax=Galactobacter valiniphilus TaxID=2676122 RepID=UPI0037361363
MSSDPRLALESLTSALAEHLNAVAARRSDDDPRVDEAYDRIAETFGNYEDALWDAYQESTPLDLFDEDPDDSDDEDEDADEDTQES